MLLRPIVRLAGITTSTVATIGGDGVGPERLRLCKSARASRAFHILPGRAIRGRVYGSTAGLRRAIDRAPLWAFAIYAMFFAGCVALGSCLSRRRWHGAGGGIDLGLLTALLLALLAIFWRPRGLDGQISAARLLAKASLLGFSIGAAAGI